MSDEQTAKHRLLPVTKNGKRQHYMLQEKIQRSGPGASGWIWKDIERVDGEDGARELLAKIAKEQEIIYL